MVTCERCKESEVHYRVQSEILDLVVCDWCALLAAKLNCTGGLRGYGRLLITPWEVDQEYWGGDYAGNC